MKSLRNIRTGIDKSNWYSYHTIWAFILVSFIAGGVVYTLQNLPQRPVEVKKQTLYPTVTPIKYPANPENISSDTLIYYGTDWNTGKPVLKVHSIRYKENTKFLNHATNLERTILYREDDEHHLQQEVKPRSIVVNEWQLVTRLPRQSDDYYYVDDELMSFKKIPKSDAILFAMRWVALPVSNKESTVTKENGIKQYVYNTQLGNLKELQLFPKDQHPKYAVPKIGSFSDSREHVEMLLYKCWNCGGHQPQTLLLNMLTGDTKNIGHVSFFKWLDLTNYEYKEYVTYPCESTYTSECDTDPDTLPMKYGTF